MNADDLLKYLAVILVLGMAALVVRQGLAASVIGGEAGTAFLNFENNGFPQAICAMSSDANTLQQRMASESQCQSSNGAFGAVTGYTTNTNCDGAMVYYRDPSGSFEKVCGATQCNPYPQPGEWDCKVRYQPWLNQKQVVAQPSALPPAVPLVSQGNSLPASSPVQAFQPQFVQQQPQLNPVEGFFAGVTRGIKETFNKLFGQWWFLA